MTTQLDELKAAVKAVAKARAEGKPIDLSTLPAPIRAKLEAQLAKLPPEARQQLQGKVDQAAHRAAGHVGAGPVHVPQLPKYQGHYNGTVRPGDASHVPWTWLAAVLLGGWVLWKFAS
jgi:hypothetical protein